jgi:UDP-N-acetylglucosamine/UDP-N-acetylgalactosamine diphosphorylase
MNLEEVYSFLKKHQQNQLIPYFKALSKSKSKKTLKTALEAFSTFCDEDIFAIEKDNKKESFSPETTQSAGSNIRGESKQKKIEPIQTVESLEAASPEMLKLGESLLREEKLGLIILAGGEGVRLGFSHPKGMFPISLVRKKTLFQLCMEKVLAAEKKYQCEISLAIMLSPLNQKEVVEFFKKHKFFGLKKEQIFFFTQTTLPFFDETGKWVWHQDHIESSPDGNGSVFSSFFNAVEKAKKENSLKKRAMIKKLDKIEQFIIFSIDNPLVDPFSLPFLGLHQKNKKEISALCMEREIVKEEKEGVFALVDNKIQIMEYFCLPQEIKESSDFRFSNPGIYCMSRPFFQKAAKIKLPFHKLIKKALSSKNLFKFERFIIDVFSFVERAKVQIVFCDKKFWFSPLKNKKGNHGIKWVQRKLFERDKKIFFSFFQKKPSQKKLEISSEFYYPTVKLEEKYKEKIPKNSYITGIDF